MLNVYYPGNRGHNRTKVIEEHSLPRNAARLRHTLSPTVRPHTTVPSASSIGRRGIFAAEASGLRREALSGAPSGPSRVSATNVLQSDVTTHLQRHAVTPHPRNPRPPPSNLPSIDEVMRAGRSFAARSLPNGAWDATDDLQFAILMDPFHINYTNLSTDHQRHCGMIFFQEVQGEMRVQWWEDRNKKHRDSYVIHVGHQFHQLLSLMQTLLSLQIYETNAIQHHAPVQWEPVRLSPLGTMSTEQFARTKGAKVVPFWEAREEWSALHPPQFLEFDVMVNRLRQWLQGYLQSQRAATRARAQAAATAAAAAARARGYGQSDQSRHV